MNRMRISRMTAAIIIFMTCLSASSFAALKTASLFTDHMVLQRGMPVPVWGTADAGSTVTVEFAGQKKTAVADASNHWKITIDPMVGSFQPLEMTIQCTNNPAIHLSNIVVGEVWICSGQSNMQMGYGGIPEIKALESSAQHIRTFNVKRTVAFTEQDACEGEWVEHQPGSAVAFSFACFLKEAADVPVGIILTCWGSSSLEAWMPRDMTETVPHFKTMMDEFDADSVTRERIQAILDEQPWSRNDDIFLRRQSNILYNAMLHPLAPYACRGLIWYQGERNTQSMFGMVKEPWFSRNSGMLNYGESLKQWIVQLRKTWDRDDFQFLAVMLPGYHGKTLKTGPQGCGPESPKGHSWGWMRESQLQALELPNTAVANTIDLGDVKNIHPKDKLPIGQRLALLAQRNTLKMDIEAQGPVFQRLEKRGNALVLSFDHATGFKTTDGAPPKGFWISDDSGKWVPAEAEIRGTTVVLQSSNIKKPLYVRYAFAGKPQVNLVNEADLPAYPFRTDRFEP